MVAKKPSTPTSISLTLIKDKDTKNAVRFAEDVEAGRERGIVGTIYVLKTDLALIGNPDKITVTIAAG